MVFNLETHLSIKPIFLLFAVARATTDQVCGVMGTLQAELLREPTMLPPNAHQWPRVDGTEAELNQADTARRYMLRVDMATLHMQHALELFIKAGKDEMGETAVKAQYSLLGWEPPASASVETMQEAAVKLADAIRLCIPSRFQMQEQLDVTAAKPEPAWVPIIPLPQSQPELPEHDAASGLQHHEHSHEGTAESPRERSGKRLRWIIQSLKDNNPTASLAAAAVVAPPIPPTEAAAPTIPPTEATAPTIPPTEATAAAAAATRWLIPRLKDNAQPPPATAQPGHPAEAGPAAAPEAGPSAAAEAGTLASPKGTFVLTSKKGRLLSSSAPGHVGLLAPVQWRDHATDIIKNLGTSAAGSQLEMELAPVAKVATTVLHAFKRLSATNVDSDVQMAAPLRNGLRQVQLASVLSLLEVSGPEQQAPPLWHATSTTTTQLSLSLQGVSWERGYAYTELVRNDLQKEAPAIPTSSSTPQLWVMLIASDHQQKRSAALVYQKMSHTE